MTGTKYERLPEGNAVTNGKSCILLLDDNIRDMRKCIREEAMYRRVERNQPGIDPDVWVSETERLVTVAERVMNPENGFDIFRYLPLTKAGTVPRNRQILVADTTARTHIDVDTGACPEALQCRIVPSENCADKRIRNRASKNLFILEIGFFTPSRRQTPMFDRNGNPNTITPPKRTAYIPNGAVTPGRLYMDRNGTKYLCLSGIRFDVKQVDDNTSRPGYTGTVHGKYVYARWTKELEQAVGNDTGFENVMKCMASADGRHHNGIDDRISVKTAPKRFVAEVRTLFDPADVRHIAITGTSFSAQDCCGKGSVNVHHEYEFHPIQTESR